MPKLPHSIDQDARIDPTAIVDEYHPSLGTRVPPTVIEAGTTVGHYAIIYSSAHIHMNTDMHINGRRELRDRWGSQRSR